MKKCFLITGFFLMLFLFSYAFNLKTENQIEIEGLDSTSLKVISFPPCALKPERYTDYGLGFVADAREFYWEEYNGIMRAYVAVYLPSGAVVRKLAASLTDVSSTGDITVYLERQNMKTGQVDEMAQVGTSILPPSGARIVRKDSTIDHAQIKNHVYSYHLVVETWETDPFLIFHGAKIVYELSA